MNRPSRRFYAAFSSVGAACHQGSVICIRRLVTYSCLLRGVLTTERAPLAKEATRLTYLLRVVASGCSEHQFDE